MPPHPTTKLHPLSKVHPSADIGAGTVVEADVEIQEDVTIGDHCIVRSGTLVREGAQVGNSCDLAAFYIGLRAKLGDGVRMDPNSSVGDRAGVGNSVHLQTRASVGHNATVGPGTTLGPRTYVHAAAKIGAGVTTYKDVRIAESVQVGDGSAFAKETKVAPNAEIGERADIGQKVRIGFDAGVGIMPPSVIGNDCTIGDEAVLEADSRMGDGCTLEASATLEYRAHMEPGSTVCAGAKVRPDATIPEGETVPPSTLVKADGTQLPRHVEIDDYNFRDNDDDREVWTGPGEMPDSVPEKASPAPNPTPDKVWIVTDINGEPHPKDGYFESREECRQHITTNIDSADDRMYDRDSMFEPAPVERAANDRDTDSTEIWIVKSDRFLAAQHGFFQSRDRAAEGREPDETIAKVQPARQRERQHDDNRDGSVGPDDQPRSLPPTPPAPPTPAADAAERAADPERSGPSR